MFSSAVDIDDKTAIAGMPPFRAANGLQAISESRRQAAFVVAAEGILEPATDELCKLLILL